MNSDIDKLLFYRGLLFGLRVAGEQEFLAEGAAFHRAFGSTIEFAGQLFAGVDAVRPLECEIDPIFGVYSEANEMLLEGEQDTVLSLANPDLRRAKFELDEGEARDELRRLPRPDLFEELGRHFKTALEKGA
jgi:hypothetical protein